MLSGAEETSLLVGKLCGKLIGMFNIRQKTFLIYNEYKVSQWPHTILSIWGHSIQVCGPPCSNKVGLRQGLVETLRPCFTFYFLIIWL